MYRTWSKKKNFKKVTFEDFLFTKVNFEIILDNN